jgi:hypothetical protein
LGAKALTGDGQFVKPPLPRSGHGVVLSMPCEERLLLQMGNFPEQLLRRHLPVIALNGAKLFSPGFWWIGFKMNRSGSEVQILQMYS